MEWFLKWWPVLVVGFNALFAWGVWSARKTFASKDDLDREKAILERRLNGHEVRMTRVEEDVKHLPNDKVIEAVNMRIGMVHGDLQRLAGTIDGLRRAVDLMNEHLLNRDH